MRLLAGCFLCLISFVFADSFVAITPPIENNGLEYRHIPEELNRPIRVGLFVGVSKVYLFNGSDTITVETRRGLVSFSNNKETAYEPIFEVFPEENGRLSVALNKKDLGKIKYYGHFVFLVQNNKLTVINVVDVEKYLYGVVPYEIGTLDSARFEALKAQAVAARTYAYSHFNSREAFQFDVFADTRDQVYKGLEKSTSLTEAAIESTKGEVMTYKGDFIQAYYHSTCSGHTEGMDAWGQPDKSYLKPKPDLQSNGKAWCEESSYHHWQRSFTEKELVILFQNNKVTAQAKDYKPFSSIRSITIDSELRGGRIGILTVSTNKGSFTVKGDRVRFLFKQGSSILPSSRFTIKKQGSSWVLNGQGFGHGIGLCQMGARARAQAGQSYVEILKHYYDGIVIERFIR